MSDMPEEFSGEYIKEARRMATGIFELLIKPHELEDHGGSPCLANRAGTIAYFAHVIGIKVIHLPLVAEMLTDYETSHAHNGNGDHQ